MLTLSDAAVAALLRDCGNLLNVFVMFQTAAIADHWQLHWG
jgi:hypothetical protein